jgi:GntR family transcriptional regulator
MFTVNPSSGQPIYAQLMTQIRHAIDSGVLQPGDGLPGIRTLAEKLIVSPNTVVRAYSELERDGLLELRQGLGAFVARRRGAKTRSDKTLQAQERVRALIDRLLGEGFEEEEIQRLVEIELFHRAAVQRKS